MTTQSSTTDKEAAAMMTDHLDQLERRINRIESSSAAQQLYIAFIVGAATCIIMILIAYAVAKLLVGG